MLAATFKELYTRELNRLKEEILKYEDEESMWKLLPGITNSGGNLCLHLVGNLNTYIAGTLGNSGYIRDRVGEFGDKDVSKERLVAMIDELIPKLEEVFDNLSPKELEGVFAAEKFQEDRTTLFALMHLLAHLNYHLGQVNYHRRIVEQ